ncbi:hypothetical protein BT96DRAFT_926952 [Gymnopus androsaceus JB14]|uniref:Uncharacterized protein n=1 Tax=Gymnopus androsaceus JB14 TaxID=1447944 RepID=A0A6A4GU40_9AGAR|nr:hypothetical protein BT96DRAFT_926952 [Gymnopus androsaceus JB14]
MVYGDENGMPEINFTDDDPQDFRFHAPSLCRIFAGLQEALHRINTSEFAIRRAIDNLLELVFVFDTKALQGAQYVVESPVKLVRFNKHLLSRYPSGIAKADGAVVLKMPQTFLETLAKKKVDKNHYRSGNNLHKEYDPTYVEYKGGLNNNGRQAILDSAAVQAVHRVLGLHVTSYSLSIHYSYVDVITSFWEENSEDVNDFVYQYTKHNNIFDLSEGIGFLKFFSFLCQLRRHHHSIFQQLSNIHGDHIQVGADPFSSPIEENDPPPDDPNSSTPDHPQYGSDGSGAR